MGAPSQDTLLQPRSSSAHPQRLRMLTAPCLQRPAFDLFRTQLPLLGSPEVDLGGDDVAQRFVLLLVVVVVREAGDLALEVP